MDITKQILRLNYAGLPIEWISYQTAVKLYCNEQVTYECGNSTLLVRGGYSRLTGEQSKIVINSIIATKNYSKVSYTKYTPPLSNTTPVLRGMRKHVCIVVSNSHLRVCQGIILYRYQEMERING